MYIYEQLASEYAKANGKDHLYGNRDFLIPVGRKCPFCNGGFADDVQKARRNSDIPSSFSNKRFKDFEWDIYILDNGSVADTTELRKGVTSFLEQYDTWEDNNMGLYLFSKTKGTGKTFLASCICNELMANRAIKTRFVRASELIDISTSGDKNAFDEYKRNPMKLIFECKFLVIDDLGQKNTGSDWLEDIIFKVLDYRMTNKRMTLITSNLPVHELPFNDRIKDRINSLCWSFRLPEVCVRSKETLRAKQDLLNKLGFGKS